MGRPGIEEVKRAQATWLRPSWQAWPLVAARGDRTRPEALDHDLVTSQRSWGVQQTGLRSLPGQKRPFCPLPSPVLWTVGGKVATVRICRCAEAGMATGSRMDRPSRSPWQVRREVALVDAVVLGLEERRGCSRDGR